MFQKKSNYSCLMSSFPSGGSAPTIPGCSREERGSRPFPLKPYPVVPWTPAAQSLKSERHPLVSNTNNFSPSNSLKPPGPIVPIGVFRSSSAENRHHIYPWTQSNSPYFGPSVVSSKPSAKPPTSSELSLCSSPGNSVELPVASREHQPLNLIMPKGQPHAVALHDFDTRIDGDLQFKTGDIIMLEEVVDDAWYRGRSVATGQVGIFPMNHVQVRIPLDRGLYTSAQPKPPLTSSLMLNGSRAAAHHATRMSPSDQFRAFSKPPNMTPPGPRGFARIDPGASENQPVRNVSRRFYSSALTSQSDQPHNPSKEHLELSSTGETKDDCIPIIRSSTPSIIHSLRPRSQVSVSQLAESLEQQGVVLNRVGPLPIGARSLFPGTAKLSGSSAPTERPRMMPNRTIEPSALPGKITPFPPPHMVETPLVLIARQQQQNLAMNIQSKHSRLTTVCTSNPDIISTNSLNQTIGSTASTTGDRNAKTPQTTLPSAVSDTTITGRLTSTQQNHVQPKPNEISSPALHEPGNPLSRLHPTHSESVLSSKSSYRAPPDIPKAETHPTNESTTVRDKIEFASHKSPNQLTSGCFPSTGATETRHGDAVHTSLRAVKSTTSVAVECNTADKRPYSADQWLLVLFDYAGTEPGDLSVKAGQVICCLDQLSKPSDKYDLTIPERWLHCVNWFGVEGQVPSTFVRRILNPEELERWMKYRPRAEAVFEFNAEAAGDLSIKIGDILYLYDAIDANWFRGENAATGERGIFPAPFVRVICAL